MIKCKFPLKLINIYCYTENGVIYRMLLRSKKVTIPKLKEISARGHKKEKKW